MCGRMNVIDDPLVKWLQITLDLDFGIDTNIDLRPTQTVGTIIESNGHLLQQNASWGIKPSWSKSLLINAKAETVAEKSTFKAAFAHRRCLVPVTGWYEWRDEGGKRKQKYLFTREDGNPWLMAGIWYPGDNGPQLVTLTTHPNEACAAIHNRMPVLIAPDDVRFWFGSSPDVLAPLLDPVPGEWVQIQAA